MPETVTIEKLVHGGYGLARTGNGVVLVSDVLEGELVQIDIVGSKSRLPFARPVSIVDPSPHRRAAACPYAGTCGGCDWQHIEYDEQLRAKKAIFEECLTRIGKLTHIPTIEVHASPQWQYRCRSQMAIDEEQRVMGFYKRDSNDVVQIRTCPLLLEPLDALLKDQEAVLRHIPAGTKQLKATADIDGNVVSSPVIPDMTLAEMEVNVSGTTFCVGGDDFFQGNACLLAALAIWPSEHSDGRFFLDLFGGTGFFTLFLADRFRAGTLVDSEASLVRRAKQNLVLNGIETVSTWTGSAEEFLEAEVPDFLPADCVLVDPPRPGLTHRVRDGLRRLKPRTIVYVSCNPATQARDVGSLMKDNDYVLERGALFDFYPQTHHLETALMLRMP